MSYTDTRQGNKEQDRKCSQKRNTAGAFPLLPSLDVKFVNISQKSIEYFDIHCNISPYLSIRFAIVNNRDIQSKKFDNRYLLKVDTLVYNRECSMRSFFFSLSSFFAQNTVSVPKYSHGDILYIYIYIYLLTYLLHGAESFLRS